MQLRCRMRLLCPSSTSKSIHPEVQTLVTLSNKLIVIFACIEGDLNKARNMGNERDILHSVQWALRVCYGLVKALHLVSSVTNRVNSPILVHYLLYDDNLFHRQPTCLDLQGLA